MLSVITFTAQGTQLAEKIYEGWREEVQVFTRCRAQKTTGRPDFVKWTDEDVTTWAGEQIKEGRSLLFIGACGIALRAVAPHITGKLSDRPVLVMDEKGNYVIPLLAGHVGGANELAEELGRLTGAIPVITTATDLEGHFAVDLFAKRNSLGIMEKAGIAKVSAKVLAGEKVTLAVDRERLAKGEMPPADVRLLTPQEGESADVVVRTGKPDKEPLLWLRPRPYVIGMGCKRGTEETKIAAYIDETLRRVQIEKEEICALASIDRKRDEQGLVNWSRKHGIPFLTYSAQELAKVEGELHESAFVRETVGVGNVCERAALRACGEGGSLIVEKHMSEGMTIAIARREWRISFES